MGHVTNPFKKPIEHHQFVTGRRWTPLEQTHIWYFWRKSKLFLKKSKIKEKKVKFRTRVRNFWLASACHWSYHWWLITDKQSRANQSQPRFRTDLAFSKTLFSVVPPHDGATLFFCLFLRWKIQFKCESLFEVTFEHFVAAVSIQLLRFQTEQNIADFYPTYPSWPWRRTRRYWRCWLKWYQIWAIGMIYKGFGSKRQYKLDLQPLPVVSAC